MKGLLLSLGAVIVFGALALALTPSPASANADDCCCVENQGALVCTVTGETLDHCCCE